MLERHLQALEAQLPELCRALVDTTEKRLREGSPRDSDDTTRAALNAWRSQQQALEPLLLAGFRGALRPVAAPVLKERPVVLDIDQLTLVDEDQADQAIEISRVIQQIESRAEWELRELSQLAAKLEGEGSLQPAAFARALSEATAGLGTDRASRALCVSAAAAELAEALRDLAHQASQRLRAWGLEPAGFAAILPEERVVEDIDVSRSGALLDLRERMHANDPAHTPASDHDQTAELLSQLFMQIMADPDLEPQVKETICRLQASVLRLAVDEPGLLGSDQHPTWALINQIADHAGDHPLSSDPRGGQFLAFVEQLVDRLNRPGAGAVADFSQALTEVRGFIQQEQEDELQASVFARLALSKQERHDELLPLLRQQVLEQAQASHHLSPLLFEFLLGPWSEALTRAVLEQGEACELTQDLLDCVEALLASLEPTHNDTERNALRQRLPALIKQLQRGMDLIELPPADRAPVLDELMQVHRERTRLAAPVQPPVAVAAMAPAPVAPLAAAMPGLKPVDQLSEDQLMDELLPPETDADQWGSQETSIAALPTVHMGLDDETGPLVAAARWTEQLQPGTRCKLFLQGQWTSAQLLWRSDNGGFYMFTSQLAGGQHSMTRRALERLRAEGLATDLAGSSLMQRAVTGMLHRMVR
ncbi:DUF1631 family protein [Pelomonas sp. V22]|uniref:DUF1631 family protein n=1 Tax=Pelomonas sp. V22 TaxID=2822139 RepID=UPI0024A8CD7E|nr:DUF1631 family protein [Pelomonas sp. V22]MDI4631858.1 DUF1631 family protein [Pelomonas sp. V22]